MTLHAILQCITVLQSLWFPDLTLSYSPIHNSKEKCRTLSDLSLTLTHELPSLPPALSSSLPPPFPSIITSTLSLPLMMLGGERKGIEEGDATGVGVGVQVGVVGQVVGDGVVVLEGVVVVDLGEGMEDDLARLGFAASKSRDLSLLPCSSK